MPPFHVEYYCPREANIWQIERGFLGSVKTFGDQVTAQFRADSLIWKYHSARVVDAYGNVVYQV